MRVKLGLISQAFDSIDKWILYVKKFPGLWSHVSGLKSDNTGDVSTALDMTPSFSVTSTEVERSLSVSLVVFPGS